MVMHFQTYKLLKTPYFLGCILSILILASCEKPIEINQKFELLEMHYDINSFEDLDSTLNYHKFDLDSIAHSETAPPVYVLSIKESIKTLKKNKKEKKRNFIRIILTHTLKVNEEISKTRIDLYKLINKDTLLHKDSIWLDSLCTEFRVKKQKYIKLIDKIDVIPPSLIIVQGIIESGWATSNYAIKGNNLFGLHGSKGKNSIKARYSGVRVQAFETIYDCVREYIFNLNRHRSYRRMRKERTKMRELGLKITGRKLAWTLIGYSENGETYIRKIVSMINYYKLERFDEYKLGKGVEIYINIKE